MVGENGVHETGKFWHPVYNKALLPFLSLYNYPATEQGLRTTGNAPDLHVYLPSPALALSLTDHRIYISMYVCTTMTSSLSCSHKSKTYPNKGNDLISTQTTQLHPSSP